MNEKCAYFNQGFCKEKNNCARLHPSAVCDGQCPDIKVCLMRHQKVCKNGDDCIFYASQSCEFLHMEKGNVDNSQTQQIIVNLNSVKMKSKASIQNLKF